MNKTQEKVLDGINSLNRERPFRVLLDGGKRDKSITAIRDRDPLLEKREGWNIECLNIGSKGQVSIN